MRKLSIAVAATVLVGPDSGRSVVCSNSIAAGGKKRRREGRLLRDLGWRGANRRAGDAGSNSYGRARTS